MLDAVLAILGIVVLGLALSARALRHRLRVGLMEAASATATAPAPLRPPAWRANLATIAALIARARNELIRVPGAAIPGVLAPTIFFLGLNGVFGALTQLSGFDHRQLRELHRPGQHAAGGRLHRRRGRRQPRPRHRSRAGSTACSSPPPRAGCCSPARCSRPALRALIPATFVLAIALALGAGFPGVDGLLVAYVMVAAMAAVAACWGSILALRFKSQSAAPLMQAGMMALILMTTAYAPLALLQRLAAGASPESTR